MADEKRFFDAKGKFALNDGNFTGHVMCFENGYATVFDRFAKVICKFSILDAPSVDATEVVSGLWIPVEDMLPKTDGRFMVTVKSRRGKPRVEIRNYSAGSRSWEKLCYEEKVLAWQARPQPWGYAPKRGGLNG